MRKISSAITVFWSTGVRRAVCVLVGLLVLIIVAQLIIGVGVDTHCTGVCP